MNVKPPIIKPTVATMCPTDRLLFSWFPLLIVLASHPHLRGELSPTQFHP